MNIPKNMLMDYNISLLRDGKNYIPKIQNGNCKSEHIISPTIPAVIPCCVINDSSKGRPQPGIWST